MMMRMFTDLYDLEDAYFAGRVNKKIEREAMT